MAAKPPRTSYVVDCPPPRHVGNRGEATPPPQERKPPDCCRRHLGIFSVILVVAAFITGIVLMAVFLSQEDPTEDPVFTVAVAGVAGLDPAVAGGDVSSPPRPLSPVSFNLTFHINNTRNREYDACVPGLSTAAVSYGDALLANGSVPPFCAKEKQESEPMAATASSNGVALPRSLWDQLAGEMAAGEAAVDVKVTMPRYCSRGCCDALLTCKAKIGGGASPPCRLDHVHTKGECQDEEDTQDIIFIPNPIPGMGMPLIPIFT